MSAAAGDGLTTTLSSTSGLIPRVSDEMYDGFLHNSAGSKDLATSVGR